MVLLKRIFFLSFLLIINIELTLAQNIPVPKIRESNLSGNLIFSCLPNNDLYRVLNSSAGTSFVRYDNPAKAIREASNGMGVLILASKAYPLRTTYIAPSAFKMAIKKKLRLYIEEPGSLPGISIDSFRGTHLERIVVSSDFFKEEGLNRLRILSINNSPILSVKTNEGYRLKFHLVAAKVAGFDSAVYGLPKPTWPILFEYQPHDKWLISTANLSNFVSGRYEPGKDWGIVWQKILQWLCPMQLIPHLNWRPVVAPTYSAKEKLPLNAEKQALKRGIAWYINSKLLVPESRETYKERMRTPPVCAPIGNGSSGILEAQLSVILPDGSQMQSTAKRGDCTGESAMALAFGGHVFHNKRYSLIARNLLNFYYFTSDARKNERADTSNGAFGLIAWGISSDAWYKANYGDDNARLLLGTLAASALLKDTSWNNAIMMCLLANLRTTGVQGFRSDRIDLPQLTEYGWKYYFNRNIVSLSGNFEAYLWACYLWAYSQTGFKLFYQRAENGLRIMMAKYTDGWRWGSSISQEKARIILPLAWLLRVKDTPEHRAWLKKAVDGLLALQEPCGAIREELGSPGKGMFPPTTSNDNYGKSEAPLFQKNGDPVSDMLYTMNFAFLGLHEAAAVTKSTRIRKAEDKIAQFLCRIQVSSPTQPSLDGGWFRAFDYKSWDYWASNADAGWGAWVIETGWSQSWITSVLAMRQMKTSLWDLTKDSKVGEHFKALRKLMIPDNVLKNVK